MMEELWKDIPEYEGIYQASNLGRIRSAPGKTTSSARFARRVWKSRIIQPKTQARNSKGYTDERVELWKNGKHKTFLVSRLVARTWVDGYKAGLTVNHIDGNPSNNHPTNLEWVTRAENIRKGFQDGLYEKNCKNVVLVSQGGEKHYFESLKSASVFLGRNGGYLSTRLERHCQGCVGADGVYWIIKT